MKDAHNKKLIACFLVALGLSSNSPNVSANFNIKQAGSNIRFAFRIFGGEKVKEKNDLSELAQKINTFLKGLNEKNTPWEDNLINKSANFAEACKKEYVYICISLEKNLSSIKSNRPQGSSTLGDLIGNKELTNSTVIQKLNDNNIDIDGCDFNQLQSWLINVSEIYGGKFTVWQDDIKTAVNDLSKLNLYERLKISRPRQKIINLNNNKISQINNINMLENSGNNYEHELSNSDQNINNQLQNGILENSGYNYKYELLNSNQNINANNENKVQCLNCKKLVDKNSITDGNCMGCNKKTQELLDQPENGFYGNDDLNNNYLLNEDALYNNQNINNQSQNYFQNNIIENSGHGYEMYNSQNIDNNIIQNYNSPNNNVCSKCGKLVYGTELVDDNCCMECIENSFQNLDNNQQNNILRNSEYNLLNKGELYNNENINNQSEKCPVCYESITSGDKALASCKKCKNIICGKCLERWGWDSGCPLCRNKTGYDLD